MSQFKGANISEIRIWSDPTNPQNSTYTVQLPITAVEAIMDFETGKTLPELLVELQEKEQVQVEDKLTSTSAIAALSSNQGRILSLKLDSLEGKLGSLTGLNIAGAVDNFTDLPNPTDMQIGTIFLVREDETRGGITAVYEIGAEREWVFITEFTINLDNYVTVMMLESNLSEVRTWTKQQFIRSEEKGEANGVASLDDNIQISIEQLPTIPSGLIGSHNHPIDTQTTGNLSQSRIAPSTVANRILRTGTANTTPIWSQVNLATDVVGVLPPANLPPGLGMNLSGTQEWRVPGTFQWTNSSAVALTIRFDIQGAGGGGSSGRPPIMNGGTLFIFSGSGGGAGESISASANVNPGATITIIVGAGGNAGTNISNTHTSTLPSNGGNSSIAGMVGGTRTALGGGAASISTSLSVPAGGVGPGNGQNGANGEMRQYTQNAWGEFIPPQQSIFGGTGGNSTFGTGGRGGLSSAWQAGWQPSPGNIGGGGGGGTPLVLNSMAVSGNPINGAAGGPGFVRISWG